MMTKVTTSGRKSFDELYEEYSSMSIPEQLNNLKRLGRELVSTMPSNSTPMTNKQERKSFDELYEEYSSL